MIILSDGTEWNFEDLERLNKIKEDEIDKKKWVDKNKYEWYRFETRCLGRDKASDVGKPLNNK